ncbi:MAG TPA: hypothetical protein VK964_17815 [Nocardioidaceae bacterium]|nr:hypothetical protein [Nocardioidaceae bacterium]
MRKSLAVALSAAVLPALLAAQPAAAGDETSGELVLHDGPGDVWTTPVGGDQYGPAPDRRAGDVLRVRLAHGEHAIRVRMKFVDLRRSGRQRFDVGMRTDAGTWYAEVAASKNRWAGRHFLWEQSGDTVSCPRMSHRIDYADDVVILRVPRTCVGNPTWARFVVNNFHETRTVLSEDNPHSRDPLPHRLTRRLHRG